MGSCLIDSKVIISLIPENANFRLNPDQDGYNKLSETTFDCDAPLGAHGILPVLKESEREELEKLIDPTRKSGWLGHSVLDNNAWKGKNRFILTLGNDPVILNLSNPMDYIKYAIARANTDLIAPNYAERLNKNCIYYMEFESKMVNESLTLADKKTKAYVFINSIKDNRVALLDLLLVLYRGDVGRISKNASTEQARNRIFEFLEKDIDSFLITIEDKDQYEKTLLFYLAIASGAITRIGLNYSLGYSNGEYIASTEGDVMNWIANLKADKEQSASYTIFKQRIVSYKDKR